MIDLTRDCQFIVEGKVVGTGTMTIEISGVSVAQPIPTTSSSFTVGDVIYWHQMNWRKLKRKMNRDQKARQRANKGTTRRG